LLKPPIPLIILKGYRNASWVKRLRSDGYLESNIYIREGYTMTKNLRLYQQIIAAGEQAGLFHDDGTGLLERPDPEEYKWALTEPVRFTLRPIEEYHRHYRGSWTQMRIKPVAEYEWGDDGQGSVLIFQTAFPMACTEGDSPDDPTLVITDILARIVDFAHSYPAEAAAMFVIPFQWHMSIDGDIIYEPGEDDWPLLDFSMYPHLEVHVPVFETATYTAWENALATLSDDSAMSLAIQEMTQRLALLFRWLDTEMPSRPPLLDL
jgi:hypothetical protein